MNNQPSLTDQIACAKRERALRQRVYPKWVSAGRMTQAQAEKEIAGMQAIIETLEKLQDPVLVERLRVLLAVKQPPA